MDNIYIQFENLSMGDFLINGYYQKITQLQQMTNGKCELVIYPPNKNITPLHFVVILQNEFGQIINNYIFENGNLAIKYNNLINDLLKFGISING